MFVLKLEKLTAMSLQGGTSGRCLFQCVWRQRDAIAAEGWGWMTERQNWGVDTGRFAENGSTSALMRAGGTAEFPVGTEPRTMKIKVTSE